MLLELHKFELDALFSRLGKGDVACGKLVLCYPRVINSVVQ